MAQFFSVHPDNPQQRLIKQAAAIVSEGGVAVYPTDSCYALGCKLGDKDAMGRMRRIRQLDEKHHFTLVCRDLAEISRYARVDNWQYRLVRANTPGRYTFVLKATREVPRRLQDPSRNTIGLRVPDHAVAIALAAELDEPIVSTSLILPGESLPLNDPEDIRARLGRQVDVILDAGPCGLGVTTVIDLTGDAPVLLRRGEGDASAFGITD
ncbi:MAG: L-threonylcarbamoyladenylate synthase [Betaproteobacteria bacterium]|nr:L-threonylcarbamoyladenylate synthase [Betaproteobacteria bacterium]